MRAFGAKRTGKTKKIEIDEYSDYTGKKEKTKRKTNNGRQDTNY